MFGDESDLIVDEQVVEESTQESEMVNLPA